jgi:hypothetical protein
MIPSVPVFPNKINALGDFSGGVKVARDFTARFMRDIAGGKTADDVKTGFRSRAIVEGGTGTASRTVGLLDGILRSRFPKGSSRLLLTQFG